MMVKKNRTKANVALPMAAVKTQPRPTDDEIIEEILRAAGLESLN